MKKRYFDYNISKESIEQMITCFKPIFKNYSAGERILSYSSSAEKVSILLSGKAKLHYIDENGDVSLLETYQAGDLFGEVFSFPLADYEYIVTAETDCTAVFLSYHHIVTPCEKVCPHHSQLINNLFIMTAQKSQELSLHISFLNLHSTRKKLLAYLRHAQSVYGAPDTEHFEIPMTLSALAEYLCVDRTAMMREIRLLKQDGILVSNRRKFKLLDD